MQFSQCANAQSASKECQPRTHISVKGLISVLGDYNCIYYAAGHLTCPFFVLKSFSLELKDGGITTIMLP